MGVGTLLLPRAFRRAAPARVLYCMDTVTKVVPPAPADQERLQAIVDRCDFTDVGSVVRTAEQISADPAVLLVRVGVAGEWRRGRYMVLR